MPSLDLQATCIYLTPEYTEYCTPRSNYGIRGALALFANPIMPLTEKQFSQLQYDFQQIKYRLTDTIHTFQEEVLHSAVQMLILDYFDIHTSLFGQQKITFQDNDLMVRFIALLEQEAYVQHREVGYYADKLFVSPKHLSEGCKQVSGRSFGLTALLPYIYVNYCNKKHTLLPPLPTFLVFLLPPIFLALYNST